MSVEESRQVHMQLFATKSPHFAVCLRIFTINFWEKPIKWYSGTLKSCALHGRQILPQRGKVNNCKQLLTPFNDIHAAVVRGTYINVNTCF